MASIKRKQPSSSGKVAAAIKSKKARTESSVELDESSDETDVKQTRPEVDGTNTVSSKEAHAKQREVARERKAAKPNADSIARSKKLWERLRRKSHVPKDERKLLVAELYEIITGRVKEFVFKHDSVRVIQTALKYATPDERKMIAHELQGEYAVLAESKYAKFLIAKLLVHGDREIRDLIVPEFYGKVRRLMRNGEAAWILDDIYRTLASSLQKAVLLREWYGPEFAIFKPTEDQTVTADLRAILAENPEKRKPIMNYLFETLNHFIQKKATGFTMLHDAMLQYFLACPPSSPEASQFLALLQSDDEGDLLKNLAFTASGAHLVCLALAYGTAKDRKSILKVYKDTISLMAYDAHAHLVLLAAYSFIDDTKLTSKAIFPSLLNMHSSPSKDDEASLPEETTKTILELAMHQIGRIPLLHIFSVADTFPGWLHPSSSAVHTVFPDLLCIRATTSKKDPFVRRMELLSYLAPPLLAAIAQHTADIVKEPFGCQFVTTVVLGAPPSAQKERDVALQAIASHVVAHPEDVESSHAGRMLKSLVQGGRFDNHSKCVIRVDPPLEFGSMLWEQLGPDRIVKWATGGNSFVVVGLVESGECKSLVKVLKKYKRQLNTAADSGNRGAKILVQDLK